MSPSDAPPRPPILVDATDGRVHLRTGAGPVWLGPCQAVVTLADGRRYVLDDNARPETGVDGLVVRQLSDGTAPELRWHFQPRPAERALALWLEVYNATGDPLVITRLDVLVAPDGFYGQPASALAVTHAPGSPWLLTVAGPQDHTLLVGFASPGAPDTGVALEDGLVAHSRHADLVLPPGGTLASELLLFVLDRPLAEARAYFEAEVAREAALAGG